MLLKKILKLSALLAAFSNIALAEEYADIATREQIGLYHCIDENMTRRQRAELDDLFSKKDGYPSEQEVINADGFQTNFIKCLKQNGSLIMKAEASKEEGENFIIGIVMYAAVENRVRQSDLPEIAEDLRQFGKEELLKYNRQFYGGKKEPKPDYEDEVVFLYACYFVALENNNKNGSDSFSKMIGYMADKNNRINRNKDEYFIKGADAVKAEMERYGGNSVKIYNDYCAEREVVINSLFDDEILQQD